MARRYPWGVAVLNGVFLPFGIVVIAVFHGFFGPF